MKNKRLNNQKITVIVPCFNVEKYLERCVESILRQTYKNIEIILVDDFSSDSTKKIIRNYVKKYKNIRAIYNKQNHRQGYSRNIAIKETKTEYISFVDSDDWLESNFLEELYKTIVKNKADLAICDIYLRHDNSVADFRVRMYSPRPNRYGFINVGLSASSSNKLFKTEILKKYEYPENIINEDISVVLAIMYKYKAVYTNKTYYNYYQRPGSTQNGEITTKRFDAFNAVDILKENIGSQIDKKTWDSIIWHQIIQLWLRVLPRAEGILRRKKLIIEFHKRAEKDAIEIYSNPNMQLYAKRSILNRLYYGSLMILLRLKAYTLSSVLMGLYISFQRHKHKLILVKKIVRAITLIFKNPELFFIKLKNKVVRKHVIKKDIKIEDLLVAAQRQSNLKARNPVSVVIPNYNYERFMLQRVYSILYQTEKIGEIIILDDNSTDQSVKLARNIQKTIGKLVPIRLINNAINLGTFKQWEKGFIEAKYEYVWIAEADDYCSNRFLEKTLKPLKSNNEVILSYVDTGLIDENGLFLESLKLHIDYQSSGHWNRDYINNGIDEIKSYSYLNNTIANVSSVLFRKKSNIDYTELFSHSLKYKQAGDWVFYLNYMQLGHIAYVNKTINYYRIHGDNVSSRTKASDHLSEINTIYEEINKKLNLTGSHKKSQKKRIKFLRKAWNV